MFQIRQSKPSKGNKFYNTVSNGGWNDCIKGKCSSTGKPDKDCDVLGNCVGYMSGRINEIYSQLFNYDGYKFHGLYCNAENIVEKAIKLGFILTQEPSVGAIMCWQKGATLSSGDGAGHVCIVEKKISDTEVYTSESGYNSNPFWNSTRKKGSGNWGQSSAYKFRGFLKYPQIYDELNKEPEPTPEPPVYKFKVGDYVIINGPLYTSVNAEKPAGSVKNKTTRITRIVAGKHPYNTTGDLGWMNESDIKLQSTVAKIKKGDKVKVNKGAKTYTGKNLSIFVFLNTYDVLEVSGDRVVIGKGKAVTAAMNINDLTTK